MINLISRSADASKVVIGKIINISKRLATDQPRAAYGHFGRIQYAYEGTTHAAFST